jgi:hypothetical protein
MEDRFDLDHAVLGVTAADAATLRVAQRMRVLAMTLHEGVLAGQLLELSGGHEPRVVEQQNLVLGCRDAYQGAHLRIRDFTAPEGIADHGEFAELTRHADALAPGDQVTANPPGEPVRARQRALRVPAAALVELTQIGEESIHGGIEVGCLFCNPFPELLEIAIHGDSYSRRL